MLILTLFFSNLACGLTVSSENRVPKSYPWCPFGEIRKITGWLMNSLVSSLTTEWFISTRYLTEPIYNTVIYGMWDQSFILFFCTCPKPFELVQNNLDLSELILDIYMFTNYVFFVPLCWRFLPMNGLPTHPLCERPLKMWLNWNSWMSA